MPRLAKHKPPPFRQIWPFFFIALLLLIISFLLYQNWQRNVVTRVIDGDSLELADGRRIRLLGVNAPERGRCIASEAASFLRQEALGRHVRLKNTITDSYSRTLATVIVEDLPSWLNYMSGWIHRKLYPANYTCQYGYDPLLNRSVVCRGLAKYNFAASPDYKETMKSAHDYARSHNLGIYSPSCRSSIPSTLSDVGDVSDLCSIKGNIRAGKHTYFLPGCSNYSDVIIDTSYGDAWFCSEEEAREAGFTKSPTCK